MVVSIINAIMEMLEILVNGLLLLLPITPFRADSIIQAFLNNQFVGWVTIFLPVEFMILFMSTYIPAVLGFYSIRWGLRILRKV